MEHPLHRIMVMADLTGPPSGRAAGMDAGVYQAWEAWLAGSQRGQKVRAERVG